MSQLRQFLRRLFDRYIMGYPPELPYTEAQLRKDIGWDDSDHQGNERAINTLKAEWMANDSIMNQQFNKVPVLIGIFGFLIAALAIVEIAGTSIAIKVVCLATANALWVVSPRLKVFKFSKREDAGRRAGAVRTQWPSSGTGTSGTSEEKTPRTSWRCYWWSRLCR